MIRLLAKRLLAILPVKMAANKESKQYQIIIALFLLALARGAVSRLPIKIFHKNHQDTTIGKSLPLKGGKPFANKGLVRAFPQGRGLVVGIQ